MSRLKLDSLPTEALRSVAEYVHDAHPSSLGSLALVNKTCHAAAITWLSRRIQFNVFNRQKLREDVKRCIDLLKSSVSLQHVRRLTVKGRMPPKLSDDEPLQARSWTLNNHNWYGHDEIFGDTEDHIFTSDGPSQILPEEDEAWFPLVELLQILPHLKDLVFDTYNQFPPILLNALNKYHPQCRLHLVKFRFRSLRERVIDAHEMALATSPCLHAIGVRWVYRDSSGRDDYNKEAVMRLVGGLAPNLKKVEMTQCQPGYFARPHNRRVTPRVPWQGFSVDDPRINPASLESLSLESHGRIGSKDLRAWQEHISFVSLRSLSLGSRVDGEALRWAAMNASLPHLTELSISLDRCDEREPTPDFGSDGVAFLASLPPLECLKLSGSIDLDILDCALERHGKSLRILSLRPYESMYSRTRSNRPTVFSNETILKLSESCPLLENLAMPVKRTKGDAKESDMYRTLGKLKHLTTIFLTLDCSNPSVMLDGNETPNDPSFDDWAQEFWGSGSQRRPRKGHIRDACLNSAIDEPLARAIWDTISRAKIGKPLESLKLYMNGGILFGSNSYQSDFMEVIQHLSRCYLLKKSVRDDDESIIVQELGRRAREARDERERENRKKFLAKWGHKYPENPPQPGTVMEVVRRIWPVKDGSQDWRDDWTSLPLQV